MQKYATHRIILYFLLNLILLIGYFFIPEQALTASFYQCDFESGNCLQEIYGNTINTFSNFGIPALPGGGSYAVTAKSTIGIQGADNIQSYYNTYSPNDLYVRAYVFFPVGYQAKSNYATSLKFMRTNDPAVGSDDDDYMLGDTDGNLRLRKSGFLKPSMTAYFPQPFPSGGISRGTWHYLEFHHKSQAGNDVMQAWVDADARTQPPTWEDTTVNMYTAPFKQLTFNLNWSGLTAPQTQQFYMDGIVADTGPIGDTYGLLGGTPPPPDTQAPSTPQGLSATPISSSQINPSWSASTDNVGVTGYRLERCQGLTCANFTQIAAPTGTSYSDTGLLASTDYRYQVRAVDAAGNLSGYSLVASATTQAAPQFGNECDNWQTKNPNWIWCDDFESDRTASYFEYLNDAGDFVRTANVGLNNSTAMRVFFQQGEVDAGNLKLAFGRTPDSYIKPVDSGTSNYRDIYWRMYLKNQPGWIGGSGDKLSRSTILATPNWAQAMIAHVWGSNADQNYLLLDPASGTDTVGNLVTTKYNDFANLKWLGMMQGATPIFSSANVGKWWCVEAHAKLNDAGQSNGIFELWINDILDAQRTNLNWVGSYGDYGINAIFFENYWNNGSPQIQERYFDNIVVSQNQIGCAVANSSDTTPPSAPTGLVVQ